MRTLIALLCLFATAQFTYLASAQAWAPDSVSGIVFFDADGDGTPDTSETTAPFAVVNILKIEEENDDDNNTSDSIESMITDEFGYFNTGDIEHGTYHVWIEIDNVSSGITVIEINDAHGAAVVNLPMYQVLIPFVSN